MASAKGMWKTITDFGGDIAKNSKGSNYMSRAVKWGAVGGTVGGATEWAGGGSFFEGAKSGAFTGAAVGAGYTAFKAGRKGTMKRNTSKMLGYKQQIRETRSKLGAGVKSLHGNKDRVQIMKDIMSK